MCAKSQVLFLPTASQSSFGRSFTSPLSITLKEIQQSISLNPIIKLNEQNDQVSVICKRRCMTTCIRASEAVKDSKSMAFLIPKVNRRNYSSLRSDSLYQYMSTNTKKTLKLSWQYLQIQFYYF